MTSTEQKCCECEKPEPRVVVYLPGDFCKKCKLPIQTTPTFISEKIEEFLENFDSIWCLRGCKDVNGSPLEDVIPPFLTSALTEHGEREYKRGVEEAVEHVRIGIVKAGGVTYESVADLLEEARSLADNK